MAAKKVTEHHLTFITEYSPEEYAELSQAMVDSGAPFTVTEVDTFVCLHCGKPWPIPSVDNSSLKLYRRCVELGTLDYCCDATRQDCEAANATG